jgi:hypothetical protein
MIIRICGDDDFVLILESKRPAVRKSGQGTRLLKGVVPVGRA